MKPNLAPPPYGIEVDLRGEKSFRLPAEAMSWRFLSLMSVDECGCYLRLIAKSLTEVPAGSLVNDEEWLIDIAGFRQRLPEWPAVRARVMHAWQACSDGRLYNLDLQKAMVGMARQKQGRMTGENTRFDPSERNFQRAKAGVTGNANPGQPGLGIPGVNAARTPSVPRANAVDYRVGESEGGDGLSEGANQGQPGLGLPGVNAARTPSVPPGAGAHARQDLKEKTLKEVTSSGRGCREKPEPASDDPVSTPIHNTPAGGVVDVPSPTVDQVDGTIPGTATAAPTMTLPGIEMPVLETALTKRERTARLNAATKAAGKPVRTPKSVLPCPMFPEKLAYLWNDIAVPKGAQRQGPLDAIVVANISKRYISAQRQVGNVRFQITTLEDWARFFEYLSQSKFLMGATGPSSDGRVWRSSLTWLVRNEEKFFKCRSGEYHKGEEGITPPERSRVPEFDPAILRAFSPIKVGAALQNEDSDTESSGAGAAA